MRRRNLLGVIGLPQALLFVLSVLISGCGSHPAIDLQRSEASSQQQAPAVRVMSWNVKRNSILPPSGVRHESFARIVRAIDPDVIALQEVLRPDLAEKLTQLMNQYIPLEDGESWNVHTVADNAVISRYPIRWQGGELAVRYPIPQLGLPNFHYGFASALVDLPERFGGSTLLVVALHNKSGASDEAVRLRQVHSDSIVRWLRDLRGSALENTLPGNSPVVILGDMNAVPNASLQPLETLLSGNIADEETFGPDFKIDWDGTDLEDARPSHNALGGEHYTWRNDREVFPPSALDRILFSDSVMSIQRRFVLNTMAMSADELASLGLQQSDVLYGGDTSYYDHLPLVVDFEIQSAPPRP